jgi:nicotinamide riboside transporter PnuC
VLVFALGENLMFFIPLVAATLAMILWHLTSMRFWLLAGIVLIILHACSFLFALAMALTIGAFGAVAMLAFCDIMLIIPLADLYTMQSKKN